MKIKALFFLVLTFVLSQTAPAQDQQSSPENKRGYLIGPGDKIVGKVFGESDYDFEAIIDEDGKFQVSFSEQRVLAKCRTDRELRTEIKRLLSKYLKNPQVSVSVTERKSRPPATIYGAITTPQQIELRRKATLMELISISGGVTEEAGGMIQVFRTQPPMCDEMVDDDEWQREVAADKLDVPSRMYSLSSLRLGREEANPVIYPGDIVIVLKASPVYITGEVVAPQGIYLKENGLSLTEAIAKIGGVRREAKTKDVKIYRLKENSREREVISVNLEMIKKGEQKDVMLEPYDIVEVDKSKKSFGQLAFEVITGAGRTGISSITQGLGTRVLY